MASKHFFKILALFAVMIVIGIITVLVSNDLKIGAPEGNQNQVAN